MLKKLFLTIAAVSVLSLGAVGVMSSNAQAVACTGSAKDCAKQGAGATGSTGETSLTAGFKIISNILLALIGMVSVIMIVIAGLKYTTSNGDDSAIKSAKNTILYSVIGIVVAIMAYAVVQYVIDAF